MPTVKGGRPAAPVPACRVKQVQARESRKQMQLILNRDADIFPWPPRRGPLARRAPEGFAAAQHSG